MKKLIEKLSTLDENKLGCLYPALCCCSLFLFLGILVFMVVGCTVRVWGDDDFCLKIALKVGFMGLIVPINLCFLAILAYLHYHKRRAERAERAEERVVQI